MISAQEAYNKHLDEFTKIPEKDMKSPHMALPSVEIISKPWKQYVLTLAGLMKQRRCTTGSLTFVLHHL